MGSAQPRYRDLRARDAISRRTMSGTAACPICPARTRVKIAPSMTTIMAAAAWKRVFFTRRPGAQFGAVVQGEIVAAYPARSRSA